MRQNWREAYRTDCGKPRGKDRHMSSAEHRAIYCCRSGET